MSNDNAKRGLHETLATALVTTDDTPAPPLEVISDEDLGTVSGGMSDASSCGGMACCVYN